MNTDAWKASLESSTVTGRRQIAGARIKRIPTLTIVAHPDPRRVGARVSAPALVSGRQMEISRTTPSFAAPGSAQASSPLADPHLSRRPLCLRPGDDDTLVLLRGQYQGECQVDGILLGDQHVIDRSRLDDGVVVLIAQRVALLIHQTVPGAPRESRRFGLVGESDALVGLRHEIRRASELDVPVLLRGETGTGKELVARAIHGAGSRQKGNWVSVNMAAIPPALAAAELFGAARGAFTGAERRPGYFRRAEGGTLFLDEIGVAPVEIQDLLLRVLETREIQPVGAETQQRVDVRVLAATDADLEAAQEDGSFRSPLVHRLRGWEIRLPPLRERRDDIARLLLHFLEQELESVGKPEHLADPGPYGKTWLGAPLLARLVAHPWPGNVRELRNVARQLVVGAHDLEEAILPQHVEEQLALGTSNTSEPVISEPHAKTPPENAAAPPAPARPRKRYRQPGEIDDSELLAALRAHGWRLQPAAETLEISRTSLYTLIDRCPEIRKASDLSRAEIEACLEQTGGDMDAAVEQLRVSRHGLLLRRRQLGLN